MGLLVLGSGGFDCGLGGLVNVSKLEEFVFSEEMLWLLLLLLLLLLLITGVFSRSSEREGLLRLIGGFSGFPPATLKEEEVEEDEKEEVEAGIPTTG